MEAGGERRFPSSYMGQSWGGLLAPPLAPNSVCCSSACQLPLHKEDGRLFSCLCISIAALPRMCQCHDGEPTVVSLLVPPGLAVLSKQDLSITHLSRQTQKEMHYHLGDDNRVPSPCFQTAVVHLRAISQVFSSQLWDLHSQTLPRSVCRYPCLGYP